MPDARLKHHEGAAAPSVEPEGPPAFYGPAAGAGASTTTGEGSAALTGPPSGWIKYPPRLPVVVLLQPEETIIELPKPKTARAVLQALGLRECTALVARDGELLTPDRAVKPGDTLLVRKVTSSG